MRIDADVPDYFRRQGRGLPGAFLRRGALACRTGSRQNWLVTLERGIRSGLAVGNSRGPVTLWRGAGVAWRERLALEADVAEAAGYRDVPMPCPGVCLFVILG
jgi:hypothetical protein